MNFKQTASIRFFSALALALVASVPAYSQFLDDPVQAEPATLIVKYSPGVFSNPQSRDHEIRTFLSSPEVRVLGHLGSVENLPERVQVVRFSSNLDPQVAAELLENFCNVRKKFIKGHAVAIVRS